MKATKIAIIGVGNVGATIAYTLMQKNLASEILLIDIDQKRCKGEELDLADAQGLSHGVHVRASTLLEARSADIIIIAAGKAQKVGQTRLDLLQDNTKIIQSIITPLKPLNIDTIIIVVTNPVDLMTLLVYQTAQLPKEQIMGSGTWLDTQRLKRLLAKKLSAGPESINVLIIGEHGDYSVPLWSTATVGDLLIKNILTKQELNSLEKQTKQEAYTIIESKCMTNWGVAACVTDICEAIILDEQRIIPVSLYDSEYDMCLSMPAVLSIVGIKGRVALLLSPEEKQLLEKSVALLQKNFKNL